MIISIIINLCRIRAYILASFYQQDIAKQLLFPFVPQFTQSFIQALQVPDGYTSDSGLKMEIVKVHNYCTNSHYSLKKNWLFDNLLSFIHIARYHAVLYCPYKLHFYFHFQSWERNFVINTTLG